CHDFRAAGRGPIRPAGPSIHDHKRRVSGCNSRAGPLHRLRIPELLWRRVLSGTCALIFAASERNGTEWQYFGRSASVAASMYSSSRDIPLRTQSPLSWFQQVTPNMSDSSACKPARRAAGVHVPRAGMQNGVPACMSLVLACRMTCTRPYPRAGLHIDVHACAWDVQAFRGGILGFETRCMLAVLMCTCSHFSTFRPPDLVEIGM